MWESYRTQGLRVAMWASCRVCSEHRCANTHSEPRCEYRLLCNTRPSPCAPSSATCRSATRTTLLRLYGSGAHRRVVGRRVEAEAGRAAAQLGRERLPPLAGVRPGERRAVAEGARLVAGAEEGVSAAHPVVDVASAKVRALEGGGGSECALSCAVCSELPREKMRAEGHVYYTSSEYTADSTLHAEDASSRVSSLECARLECAPTSQGGSARGRTSLMRRTHGG